MLNSDNPFNIVGGFNKQRDCAAGRFARRRIQQVLSSSRTLAARDQNG
jgi:hypothetical protein